MVNWLKERWHSLHRSEPKADAEVERIAALQQAAVQRRAEYAAAQARAAETPTDGDTVAASREQVQEAEAAYAAALQAWDNKQFRRRTNL